jgi:hydroxymethylbilane synthase
LVAAKLRRAYPGLSTVTVEVTTTGDIDQESSITELTELGAFVRAVQQKVLDGEADLAIHSLKDLPVLGPPELVITAIPERGSAFDAIVGGSLDQLPFGATVGAGSPRRTDQLRELRGDLKPVPIRGNVDTRLRKVAAGELDAIIVAEAALDRLGTDPPLAYRLHQMVPSPGQGALAVEARRGSGAAALATAIDDAEAREAVSAERALLAATGAGCRASLGARAWRHNGHLMMDVFVCDERGARRTKCRGSTTEKLVAEVQARLGI